MSKELDKLVENIKNLMDPINNQLKTLGANQKTIDSFFEGEEILICPNCNTFNFKEIYYDEKEHFSDYQCGECLNLDRKYWRF